MVGIGNGCIACEDKDKVLGQFSCIAPVSGLFFLLGDAVLEKEVGRGRDARNLTGGGARRILKERNSELVSLDTGTEDSSSHQRRT